MKGLKFKFLNKVIPVRPVNKEVIKPQERGFLKVETPHLDELSVLGIIKFIGLNNLYALTIR